MQRMQLLSVTDPCNKQSKKPHFAGTQTRNPYSGTQADFTHIFFLLFFSPKSHLNSKISRRMFGGCQKMTPPKKSRYIWSESEGKRVESYLRMLEFSEKNSPAMKIATAALAEVAASARSG